MFVTKIAFELGYIPIRKLKTEKKINTINNKPAIRPNHNKELAYLSR